MSQSTPNHIRQLQNQPYTPLSSPIVGCITADQLQQVNMLWAQMINILTSKNGIDVTALQQPLPQVNLLNHQLQQEITNHIVRNTTVQINDLLPPSPHAKEAPKSSRKNSQSTKSAKVPISQQPQHPVTSLTEKIQQLRASQGKTQASLQAPGTEQSTTVSNSVGKASPEKPSKKSTSKAEKGEKEKRPFKGKSAFMCFKDSQLKEYIAANPGKKVGECIHELGNQWKAMNEEQQKPYQEMSKADHARRLEEQKNALPEQQRQSDQSPQVSEKPAHPTPIGMMDQKKVVAQRPLNSSFSEKKQNTPKKKVSGKDPFFFYMQIRKSELLQERQINEANGKDKDCQLPKTQQDMQKHIQQEWQCLTPDQQKRFLIPEDIQNQLRERNQMSDVEVLRQLVLTQKLPPLVESQREKGQPAFGVESKSQTAQ